MPTEPRLPNLFLVGAQKSGTTTLAVMLSQHPEIYMCQPKEPGYLAFGAAGYRALNGYGRPAAASSWVVASRAEYLDLFQDAPAQARYLGDASTWYLSEPGMAARLHNFNAEARILIILRQPADRAYSAWCHARRDNEEPYEQFAQALQAEPERKNPSHLLRYREMSHYLAPVRDYIKQFGRDRVHIMFYEDLRDRPESLWRGCCNFLGLETTGRTPAAHRQNRSGLPRSRTLHRLVRSPRIKRTARRLLPLPFVSWAKERIDQSNLRRLPPLPRAERNALSREFSAEIEGLMNVTNRNLREWLPDE